MREGYKKTVLGEIPEEWEVAKFGDVVNNFDSKRIPLKSEDRANKKGIYPYYGAQGIIDFVDDFIFEGIYLLIAEDGENVKSRKNDIAFIADGKFWLNNHAHIVRSNGKSDILFLKYLLNHISIKEYVTGQAQPKLNKSSLEVIKLSLPSLTEQQKIANILSTVDQKIENIEQQISETTQLKKGLMQKLLTKGIGHTKFKDSPLGEIPESWEVVKLGSVAEIIDPHPSHRAPKEEANGFPFVGIGDINEAGDIDLSKVRKVSETDVLKQKETFVLQDYDMGFGRVASIGKIVWFKKKEYPYGISPTMALVRVIGIDPIFLNQFLKSQLTSEQFRLLSVGSTRTSIGMMSLRTLLVCIPNSTEQQKIATILTTVDNKLEVLQEKKTEYQQLKKGLMQQLLTGKIRTKKN
ncbi:restriction endonuclease subunit S [Marinifilum flexuosum]|uniref:restriction endonuclease subunit S n=1 Tax=Marinifilum flexuosum TaxID=1117708 RepID=UPI002495395A|nr:restriction endonuclease subunit S [Marinifilum flexuosum]